MSHTTHVLSPIAEACGVTLADVARVLPLAWFPDGMAVIPADTPPALAVEVARCGLGAEVEFSHLKNGMPVYYVA